MHIINEHSIGITAEALFRLCAESFADEDYKTRLLGYTDKVQRHAERNERCVPDKIREFLDEVLPEQVPAEDMIKVYEQKLVGGKYREYYDRIKGLAPLNRCPICDVNTVDTLDHYLPKSDIPTLAVDPGNLIPACGRCNRLKSDHLKNNPDEMPVHLYYDRIPEGQWLRVKLGANLEAEYEIQCPDTADWGGGIRARVSRHLDTYKLGKVYSHEAAVELANLQSAWKTELEDLEEETETVLSIESLKKEFSKFIRKRRRTYERLNENSFESAFYRGLEQNMDIALTFFKLNEPAGVV